MDPSTANLWLVLTGLVAAVFAGLSWWQSKKSADASKASEEHAAALARVELERRHDELKPEFELTGREVDAKNNKIEFTFRLLGPLDSYDTVTFALVQQEPAVIAGLNVAEGATTWRTEYVLENAQRGHRYRFWGLANAGSRDAQHFNVRFVAASDQWTVSVPVTIKWVPRVFFA